MRSQDKFELYITEMPQYENKEWVKIKFRNHYDGTWIPSFEDLERIIRAICECEDRKYPNGKGRKMVLEFLHDVVKTNFNWEALAYKYKIPLRT